MKRVKFGDIVREVKIQVDRSNNPYLHYVAGDHMDSMDLTIRRKGSFATDDVGPAFIRIFKPGQVLYGSRRTYLKKIAVADFEGICSNTTFVLETKDSNVFLQELLPFIMLSESFTKWSISHSKGSTNPYVLFSDLANYEFTLPSLSEQKVLADNLWAAYRVKESYKKLLAATDDMLKAKFMEMFGGQGVVTLSEACDIVMGTSPDSQYYNTNCEGLPFYQGKTEFTDMYIGGAEVWCTKPIRVAEKNEILMSVRAPVGAINIAAEKCCIGRGLCSLKPKDNVTKLLFVFYALKLQEEEISRLGTGSTFKAVNKDQVYNKITLPLPPLPLQQQFVEIATQAEATKESLRKSIENIDQVIKSLINQ